VGAAEAEDDGEPFDEKMKRLTTELARQFAESHELEETINKTLRGLGYGN
jgi:type I restriction enzyme M protein